MILFKSEVTFLGFLVNKDGVRPTLRNINKIKQWPVPKNPTQVRGFASLASFYRRFIANFSSICAPLYDLTKTNVDFVWTETCQKAFDTLKEALSSAPIVAHPDFDLPWLLYTDASHECIGSVLAQVHKDNRERVVEYFSSKLSEDERKWCTFDKEFYAIVASVRKFRHYLRDSKFTIITDHRPLLSLRKMNLTADYTGKRARWVLELDPLDWTIQYKPGKKHNNADSMSRYPHDEEQDNDEDSDVHDISLFDFFMLDEEYEPLFPSNNVELDEINALDSEEFNTSNELPSNDLPLERSALNNDNSDNKKLPLNDPSMRTQNQPTESDIFTVQQDELRTAQQLDTDIQKILSWMKTSRPRHPKHKGEYITGLWKQFETLRLDDNGILYRDSVRSDASGNSKVVQAVIPKAMIPSVLSQLHGSILMGHSSSQTAVRVARQYCYWPRMGEDIEEFCKSCQICQQHTNPVPAHRAPLLPILVSRKRHIAIDITEMPISHSGYRYILTVTDLFTKYLEMYPMKDQTAISVARELFENYVPNHSLPISVHSDRGRQFEARVFKLLMSCFGIKKTRTTSYRPSANGQIERVHRDLKSNITRRLLDSGLDARHWDKYLNHVKLCYNSSRHSTTGFSPFLLETGEEPLLPIHILFGYPGSFNDISSMPISHQEYVRELKQRVRLAYAITQANAAESKQRQAFYYNRSTRFAPYEVEDLVWLKNERRADKISPRWLGPYRIFSRSDDGRLYQILDISKNAASPVTVHYDKLKPHVGLSPLVQANLRPTSSHPWTSAQGNIPATVNLPGPSNEVPAPIVAISAPSPPATPHTSPAQSLHNSGNSENMPQDSESSAAQSVNNNNESSLHQSATDSSTGSNASSFSPLFTSTPETELTPSRTGRRRYRPLRLADFLTYQ